MAKNILLEGYYGAGNLGDEAILQSVIELVQQHYENCNIIVSSKRPRVTENKYSSIDRSITGFFKDKSKYVGAISDTDTVIIGGGGLLKSDSITYYAAVILLSRLLNTKVYIFSVGVTPDFDTRLYRLILRYGLASTQAITVRDHVSKTHLQEYGIPGPIEIIPDAALLRTQESTTELDGNNELVLILRDTESRQVDVEGITDGINNYASYHNINISLVVVNYTTIKRDISLAVDIRSKLHPECSIEFINRLDEIETKIRNACLIISVRLHGTILAAKYNTPFISLEYGPKCINVPKEFADNPIILPCDDVNDLCQHISDNHDNDKYITNLTSSVSELQGELRDGIQRLEQQQSSDPSKLSLIVLTIIAGAVLTYQSIKSTILTHVFY